jgi:hypothetical protein
MDSCVQISTPHFNVADYLFNAPMVSLMSPLARILRQRHERLTCLNIRELAFFPLVRHVYTFSLKFGRGFSV